MTTTLNLSARIARLEADRPVEGDRTPMPPELAGIWLKAIAIGLGGYPQPPRPAPSYLQDTLGDGFARGLDYADEADMEARLEADPDEWQKRMKDAEAALFARYVRDPDGKGLGRGPAFQAMIGALDEVSRAQSANNITRHWPSEQPRFDGTAKSVRRALTMFDIVSEEQIAEACS